MATYQTFTTLTSDLQTYLERGNALTDAEVFDQLPRIINNAERKIMQFLKLQGTLEVLVDPVGLPANVAVITKPDRWRQTVSMNYGTGTAQNTRAQIRPRSYEYLRTYWPDDSQTNPPVFYADYDYLHWIVAPTPDQTYPLESLCYLQPVLLDSANQTNFFTDYTPNLLLYASLMESAPFLKDDTRIALWQDWLTKELQSLDSQDMQRILDRNAVRSRP